MAKVSIPVITLRDAEKLQREGESSLFVMNRLVPSGNINFNVGSSTVTIPVSRCPFDVSTIIETDKVLSNPNFRKLVAKRAILIAEPEFAYKFTTEDSFGIKETKRMTQIQGVGAESEGQEVSSIEIEAGGNAEINSDPAELTNEDEITPFVTGIVSRSFDAEEDSSDLIDELEAQIDFMKPADFQYIIEESSNEALKSWAAENIELVQ